MPLASAGWLAVGWCWLWLSVMRVLWPSCWLLVQALKAMKPGSNFWYLMNSGGLSGSGFCGGGGGGGSTNGGGALASSLAGGLLSETLGKMAVKSEAIDWRMSMALRAIDCAKANRAVLPMLPLLSQNTSAHCGTTGLGNRLAHTGATIQARGKSSMLA